MRRLRLVGADLNLGLGAVEIELLSALSSGLDLR